MSSIKKRIEESVGLSSKKDEKLYDYITKKEIPNKPENREAKVVIEERLNKEYLYPLEEMQPEFPIQKGSVLIGFADIVVFHNSTDLSQENIKVIVECKRKDRKDGIEQLKSYLAGCKSAEYGVWFNGNDITYIKRLERSPHWKEIPNIPRRGEDLGLPDKSSLKEATELVKVFETCHNYIYANDGLLKDKVFNEILKILFIKIMDERDYTTTVAKFGITEREYDEIIDGKQNDFESRINGLFNKAKMNYKDIFPQNERLELKLSTLAFVVGQLQYFDLSHSSRDVKGLAFQKFVYAHQRGDRGEFFTPDPIIELTVNMLKPQMDEIVLDPACGTGGFLVAALKYVENNLKKTILNPVDLEKAKTDYAINKLRGIDFNPDLVRVSKMRMILEEDGHTGIFHANSLETIDKIRESALKCGALNVEPNTVNVILTNPPFGKKGKVTEKGILSQYKLGRKYKKQGEELICTKEILDEQVPDVLFIERCYELLAPGGRMGIVLPDGILSGPKMQFVRDFIFSHFKVVGIISLPYETFIPHGANVKASILLLVKIAHNTASNDACVENNESCDVVSADINNTIQINDYNTFMAEIEKIGYQGNKNGTLIYKTDDKGNFILDCNGEKILDEDVSDVLEQWESYTTQDEVWKV